MKEVSNESTTGAPLEHLVTESKPATETHHEEVRTETSHEQIPAKDVEVRETTVTKD